MHLLESYKPLGIIAGILAIAAVLAGIATPASTLTWLSLALAVFLYFFVPGYTWLLLLELDAVERCIFAFLVGAIVVPLLLYFLNIIGIPLTRITVLAAVIAMTGIPLFLWFRKKQISH